MMISKPPIERIQFPGEQWYDLIGPPGVYECSHQQNGCRLLRETDEAVK